MSLLIFTDFIFTSIGSINKSMENKKAKSGLGGIDAAWPVPVHGVQATAASQAQVQSPRI